MTRLPEKRLREMSLYNSSPEIHALIAEVRQWRGLALLLRVHLEEMGFACNHHVGAAEKEAKRPSKKGAQRASKMARRGK